MTIGHDSDEPEQPAGPPRGALRLENEFASVWVSVDEAANGVRLRITDAATGRSLLLDPLQLESLAWARQADLRFLMEPSYRESVVREIMED